MSAVALVLIVALFLALALYNGGQEPLWLDEQYSLTWANLPSSALMDETASKRHQVLYYAILKLWVSSPLSMEPPSEAYLRFLSTLLVTLSIPLLFAFVRASHGSRSLGLLVCLLLVTSPFVLETAREVRPEALYLPVTAGLLLVLALMSRRDAALQTPFSSFLKRDADALINDGLWLAAAALLMVSCLAHPSGVVFAVAFTAIYAMYNATKSAAPRRLFNLCVALLPAAILYGLFFQPHLATALAHSPQNIGAVELSVVRYIGTVKLLAAIYANQYVLLWFVAFLGLAAAGALALWKGERRPLLFSLLILAVLFPVLMTFLDVLPYRGRVAVWGIIPFLCLVSTGLVACLKEKAPVAAILLVLVLAANGFGIYGEYQREKEGWDDLALYIRENSEPGDAVIVPGGMQRDVFDRYWNSTDGPAVGIYRAGDLDLVTGENPAARVWTVNRHSRLDGVIAKLDEGYDGAPPVDFNSTRLAIARDGPLDWSLTKRRTKFFRWSASALDLHLHRIKEPGRRDGRVDTTGAEHPLVCADSLTLSEADRNLCPTRRASDGRGSP